MNNRDGVEFQNYGDQILRVKEVNHMTFHLKYKVNFILFITFTLIYIAKLYQNINFLKININQLTIIYGE